MSGYGFFVDPSRCIGCKACENACAECDTHRGTPMIHVDFIDRARSIATVPTVCMHCDEPTCAEVCPADAIKKTADGIVQSALKPRCVACNNCVLACPFGVPKMMTAMEQMMKCDMCYDRTSEGRRPMCATVCPSQALSYVVPEAVAARRERPLNAFRFGNQTITTRVHYMVPPGTEAVSVDVVDYMWEGER